MELQRLPAFDFRLDGIRAETTRARILVALQRLASGNAGDSKSLGRGLFELRIHVGPGYRVYYTRHGPQLILLLLCGSKATQDADIESARKLMR